MQIQVSKLTDVSLLRKACGFTIDRESKIGLDSIYRCEHSPCRTQIFCVEMRDIATFVSVHLVRHKVGVEHFVKSNREDRLGYTGDLGRRQPVNHMMIANAQALIQMARKRLCSQAHVATQEVMEAIKQEVAKVDPDLARYMVPECEYRNGYCPELRPCGRVAPIAVEYLGFTLPSITLPGDEAAVWEKYKEEKEEWAQSDQKSLDGLVELWDCVQVLQTHQERGGNSGATYRLYKRIVEKCFADGLPVIEAKQALLVKNAVRGYYSKDDCSRILGTNA